MDNTDTLPPSTEGAPWFIEIAGYRAIADPWSLQHYSSVVWQSKAEADARSLQKLHDCGFDIDSLDAAHATHRISPIRVASDIRALMGYDRDIIDKVTNRSIWGDEQTTAIGLPYPNPAKRGELLPHTQMFRVRYPGKPRSATASRGGMRYEQPRDAPDRSTSEPYFLPSLGVWDLIHAAGVPLIITEGELKAACLNLAGYAAIGFGGVEMWRAPKKAGKGKLHYSLDPCGPRKGNTITLNREIYLLPDADYTGNERVRKSFRELAKALIIAGVCSVRIIHITPPIAGQKWKDIDEFLLAHLGARWAGDDSKVVQAHRLVADLMASSEIIRSTDRYKGTDTTRGAERILTLLEKDKTHTAVATATDGEEIGWLTFNRSAYRLEHMAMTTGSSGKFGSPSARWLQLANEDWEAGVDSLISEGDCDKAKPTGMPNDYPNKVFAIMHHRLPRYRNDTLIEPFDGVAPGDTCVRINHALVNVTKAFASNVDWATRHQWLLPPDHRWFGTGQINVTLRTGDEPECPKFLATLENAFANDPESMLTLQMFLGKILCCPLFVGTQQFLAMYGPGGSGKGTICRLLGHLMGAENVASLRPQGDSRFEFWDLPGKKLIMFEEADNRFSEETAALIKQVTGQDKVICERKGRDPKSITLDAEIVTVSNQPPRITMDASAYSRRVVFLKFVNSIATRDHRVEACIVANELPGIFLWGLRGAVLLHAGTTITTPASAREDLEDETLATSPEYWFVREELERTEESAADGHPLRLTGEQIMDRYMMWLREKRLPTRDGGNRNLLRIVRDRLKVSSASRRVAGDRFLRAYYGIRFVNHTAGKYL